MREVMLRGGENGAVLAEPDAGAPLRPFQRESASEIVVRTVRLQDIVLGYCSLSTLPWQGSGVLVPGRPMPRGSETSSIAERDSTRSTPRGSLETGGRFPAGIEVIRFAVCSVERAAGGAERAAISIRTETPLSAPAPAQQRM